MRLFRNLVRETHIAGYFWGDHFIPESSGKRVLEEAFYGLKIPIKKSLRFPLPGAHRAAPGLFK